MVKRAGLVFIIGCSAPAKHATISSRGPAESSPMLVTDAPMDCSSHTEDSQPGNHDRFAFEGADGRYGYEDSKGNVVITPALRFAYEFCTYARCRACREPQVRS